jgi:hypothetical protein
MPLIRTMSLLLSIAAALGVPTVRADDVRSACAWTPPRPHTVVSLNSEAEARQQGEKSEAQKAADNDYLVIAAKGRSHFHSLPDESCKSDVFLVAGDLVEHVASFPAEGVPRFMRVLYFSKRLKREITGWIPAASLCRATGSGSFDHCGVTVRQ